MIDEATFRRESDRALESLKQSLISAEDDDGTFEFEDNNGVMNIIFENGSSKFVITPNTPIRQVWISAQATSFKLDWSESAHAFTLTKTGAVEISGEIITVNGIGPISITGVGPVNITGATGLITGLTLVPI